MNESDTPQHYFLTRNDGMSTVKAPKGMFADSRIPNDIQLVINAIEEYNN